MTAYLVTTTTTIKQSVLRCDVGARFKNANQILLKQRYYETYY